MKDCCVIENHNESLHIWKTCNIKKATVLHFDSHHDMYNAGNIPWISNYLLFALAENIIDTLYVILPGHVFSLPDKLTSAITSVYGIKDYERITDKLYRVWVKHYTSCIYFCEYSTIPNSFDGEVLLDIDVDYFIYNCAGCLVKGNSSYCINIGALVQLPQIRVLAKQARITTISLSVFGGYVPIEFQFLGSWLKEYFSNTSADEALHELKVVAELYCRNKCISNEMHYIPRQAVALLNACSTYKIGNYSRSVEFFSGVSTDFISKYRNFLTNWEYYFFYIGKHAGRLL